MSATQYRVKVLSVVGRDAKLSFRLCGDMERVHAEPDFLARVLAESYLDFSVEQLKAIWPEFYELEPEWVRLRIIEHHLIDPASIRLLDPVNHPRERPSARQLIEPLKLAHQAQWARDPSAVVKALAHQAHGLGGALEFESEPALYAAGTLDEVCEEVASLQLEQLASRPSSATLAFRVTDTKVLQHLVTGQEFDSCAFP